MKAADADDDDDDFLLFTIHIKDRTTIRRNESSS